MLSFSSMIVLHLSDRKGNLAVQVIVNRRHTFIKDLVFFLFLKTYCVNSYTPGCPNNIIVHGVKKVADENEEENDEEFDNTFFGRIGVNIKLQSITRLNLSLARPGH